ncbi:TerD domain-containing protein, partial [Pelagophyceae sp. CCMP2097]
GDQRSGAAKGDDEQIHFSLSRIDPRARFVGLCINSYSGQELDDVSRTSCHLFDSSTRRDFMRFEMTGDRALDKHTAVIVGILCRDGEGEWVFKICVEPAHGSMV